MPTTQDNRLMAIHTPLGKDFLLINRFTAQEGLSELYSIDAELVVEMPDAGFEPTVIDPRSLLGQGVTIEISAEDGSKREFSGIVNKFSQGKRDVRFSYYYISIVPHVWLLTQKSQSRIFQQKNVPDILLEVFSGFRYKNELQRKYDPRNYCVQYRETDWDFVSRLMEEEGIYYYFEHTEGNHQLIIADTPLSHRDCPGKSTIPYFINVGDADDFIGAISSFINDVRIKTGKVTLWDFNFELPTNQLNMEQPSRFSFGDSQKLELYDYPGGYARKYDGIDKSGGAQAAELQKIFTDREATVKNMMDSLDAGVSTFSAHSDCCSIVAGYRFALSNNPNSNLNKQYVITSATHEAEQNPSYVSNEGANDPYTNSFTCIPHGAGNPPFRPSRRTSKPVVYGSQTAIVVGPAGEEIFTDKYGRVKVQFHWDRHGQTDASSSCWLRVAQIWAGNKWGSMFIPRIGMEVVVNFLEGDPDQPIIVGCVYNPQTMPAYTLPDHKTKSGIKTNSSKGGGGFNEIRFEDKKGSEQIFFHGQKDQDIRMRNNRRELIGNDRHLIVKRDKREKVERDEHIIIKRDLLEKIERDHFRTIKGKAAYKTEGSLSYEIKGARAEKVGGNYNIDVTGDFMVSAQNIVLEAKTGLTIKVGGNFVSINAGGVQINGTMVLINSGGAALPIIPGSLVPPLDPQEAEIADNADPGSDAPTYKNQRRQLPPAIIPSYTQPSHDPTDPKNKDKKSWIELELLDEQGNPVAGERYRVTLTDGKTIAEGTTDEKGFARVSNIDPGNCKITFPRLDKEAWKQK